MKIRSRIYLLILLATMMFTACFEEREKINLTWVAFEDDKIEVLESANEPVSVNLAYSGPLQANDIQISYTISTPDGAVEGEDFELPVNSGTATIPAGQAVISFTALSQLLDNDVSDGPRSIVLTLESAGGLTLGYPGPDARKKSITIIIKDDDCVFDLATLAGDYNVEIISEASFGNPSGSYFAETTISVGSAPNTLRDANFWDFGNPGIITINPDTKAITIEGAQFLYQNASGLSRYAIQGSQPQGSIINNCGIFEVFIEVTREDQSTVANRSRIIYTKK